MSGRALSGQALSGQDAGSQDAGSQDAGSQDALCVWYGEAPVGMLRREAGGRIAFQYDSTWTGSAAFPLSQSMPLSVPEYDAEGGTARRFFANLLPEGVVRTGVSRHLKIPDTDFEMLRALGGECAGALSILPVGSDPEMYAEYKALDEAELQERLVRRGTVFTSLVEEDRPRLSLAGAQDKIPVLIRNGMLYMPRGNAPSSHILKFESPDFRHVILLEAFTMDLAAAFGLRTPAVSLRGTVKNRYLVVERYDRMGDGAGRRKPARVTCGQHLCSIWCRVSPVPSTTSCHVYAMRSRPGMEGCRYCSGLSG